MEKLEKSVKNNWIPLQEDPSPPRREETKEDHDISRLIHGGYQILKYKRN